MLATYMRRLRKNNLEIRIVGSSGRPQQLDYEFESTRVNSQPST